MCWSHLGVILGDHEGSWKGLVAILVRSGASWGAVEVVWGSLGKVFLLVLELLAKSLASSESAYDRHRIFAHVGNS